MLVVIDQPGATANMINAPIPSLLRDALPPGVRALRVDDPRPLRREVVLVTRPDPSINTQTLTKALSLAAQTFADPPAEPGA